MPLRYLFSLIILLISCANNNFNQNGVHKFANTKVYLINQEVITGTVGFPIGMSDNTIRIYNLNKRINTSDVNEVHFMIGDFISNKFKKVLIRDISLDKNVIEEEKMLNVIEEGKLNIYYGVDIGNEYVDYQNHQIKDHYKWYCKKQNEDYVNLIYTITQPSKSFKK